MIEKRTDLKTNLSFLKLLIPSIIFGLSITPLIALARIMIKVILADKELSIRLYDTKKQKEQICKKIVTKIIYK